MEFLLLLVICVIAIAGAGPNSGFSLFLVFATIAALSLRWRNRVDRLEGELRGRVADISAVRNELTRVSEELRQMKTGAAPPRVTPVATVPAPAPAVGNASSIPTQKPTAPVLPVIEPSDGVTLPTIVPPLPAAPTITARTDAPQSPPAAAPTRVLSTASVPMRTVTPAPPPLPLGARMRRSTADLEELVGGNLLNKLGIFLLVIGAVSFLATQWQSLPVWAKDLLLLAGGGLLLGGGIFLEKKERYRLFARTLIGGGWAMLFYTSYALYHVSATRILPAQWIDLLLMLLTAGAMVWHTLKYCSQVVTGIAYLLAFTTVAISQDTVFSLSAGAVLAVSLVVLVLKMRWYELEIFGILASYLNHFRFLYPTVSAMGSHHRMFPAFYWSTGILLLYWGTFRVSYVIRHIESKNQENVSTLAALLNTFLLLGVMKYQSVNPQLAFCALLGLGVAEFALGQLPITRLRRTAFLILTTLGATLMIAAVPFNFAGNSTAVLWLAGAEALLVAGILVAEVAFRRLGMITGLATAAYLVYFDFKPWAEQRVESGAPANVTLGILLLFCALVFFGDAHLFDLRWRELFDERWDRRLRIALSYSAATLAALGLWALFPWVWTIVVWSGLMLVLTIAANRLRRGELAMQSFVLAVLVVSRCFVVNLPVEDPFAKSRLLTVSLTALLLYFSARFVDSAKHRLRLRSVFLWLGTIVISALAWFEAGSLWVPVLWSGFAVVLLALWRRFALTDFYWQAHALALAAFLYAYSVNMFSAARWHGWSERLISIALISAAIYLSSWLCSRDRIDGRVQIADLYSWTGSLLATTLLWHELRPIDVALGWAIFGIVLFELGLERRLPPLRWQGGIALCASFTRIFFVNLNAAGAPGHIDPRTYSIVPLALLYLYAYWRTLARRDAFGPSRWGRLAPMLFSSLGVASIAFLLRFEAPAPWVVSFWAGMALVLLGVCRWTGQGGFLYQAVVLGASATFRSAMYNLEMPSYFWTTDTRALTVGAVIALFLLALPFAFALREQPPADLLPDYGPLSRWLRRISLHPEQFFFFAAIGLLTALIAVEMTHGEITVGWGAEAVAVFILALWLGERSFRLCGLGLLLLAIGKLFIDVWGLPVRDRTISMTVLGAVLLLVSFLYSRHREAIRKYL